MKTVPFFQEAPSWLNCRRRLEKAWILGQLYPSSWTKLTVTATIVRTRQKLVNTDVLIQTYWSIWEATMKKTEIHNFKAVQMGQKSGLRRIAPRTIGHSLAFFTLAYCRSQDVPIAPVWVKLIFVTAHEILWCGFFYLGLCLLVDANSRKYWPITRRGSWEY